MGTPALTRPPHERICNLVPSRAMNQDWGSSRPRRPAPWVGSPGQVVYRFKALRPGQTEIPLKRLRSWKGDRPSSDRFRVSLHIDAKSTNQGGPHPARPAHP